MTRDGYIGRGRETAGDRSRPQFVFPSPPIKLPSSPSHLSSFHIVSIHHTSTLTTRYTTSIPDIFTMSTDFETPSKPLANGLSGIDLTNGSTTSSAALNAKLQASADVSKTAKSDAEPEKTEPVDEKVAAIEAQELEDSRKKFVGEVDLPESEEPLLKESKSRFVLFPIKYREVSILMSVWSSCTVRLP